jgi:hypothetical protein
MIRIARVKLGAGATNSVDPAPCLKDGCFFAAARESSGQREHGLSMIDESPIVKAGIRLTGNYSR